MNWKEFLKPDWRKILLFVILSILLSAIPNFVIEIPVFCGLSFGIPLPFYCSLILPFDFNGGFVITNLFVDIIFWYLLSCLIVWIYGKLKKEK